MPWAAPALLETDGLDIPVHLGPEVMPWVRYFVSDGRRFFTRWLARAALLGPRLREELRAAGLPQDLLYLAMIESGLEPRAVSLTGAAGLWQLAAPTALELGLEVTRRRDERLDPGASTVAATRLLQRLYRRFPSSELAWTAYNAGPEAVDAALRSTGAKDLEGLVRAGALSPEAANFAPKLVAAALVARNAARLGFQVPSQEIR